MLQAYSSPEPPTGKQSLLTPLNWYKRSDSCLDVISNAIAYSYINVIGNIDFLFSVINYTQVSYNIFFEVFDQSFKEASRKWPSLTPGG